MFLHHCHDHMASLIETQLSTAWSKTWQVGVALGLHTCVCMCVFLEPACFQQHHILEPCIYIYIHIHKSVYAHTHRNAKHAPFQLVCLTHPPTTHHYLNTPSTSELDASSKPSQNQQRPSTAQSMLGPSGEPNTHKPYQTHGHVSIHVLISEGSLPKTQCGCTTCFWSTYMRFLPVSMMAKRAIQDPAPMDTPQLKS